jgi:hypothetical protein
MAPVWWHVLRRLEPCIAARAPCSRRRSPSRRSASRSASSRAPPASARQPRRHVGDEPSRAPPARDRVDLEHGGGVLAAVAAALPLNARYAPASIAVAPGFEGPRWRRLLSAQLIVDECSALSSRRDGLFDMRSSSALLAVVVTAAVATALARAL